MDVLRPTLELTVLLPGMLLAYLPILIAISLITGLFTGLCAQFLLNRGKNFWKTIFR